MCACILIRRGAPPPGLVLFQIDLKSVGGIDLHAIHSLHRIIRRHYVVEIDESCVCAYNVLCVYVCVCVCVRERERERVCVCVCVRG